MQPEQSDQPDQTQPDQAQNAPAPESTWQQPEMVSAEPHAYEGPAQSQPDKEREDEVESPVADERQPLEGEEQAVRWQGSEYIHRDKDMMWYAIFAVVTVVLVLLALLVIKSWTFAVLIPVMAAAIVVMARRPPVVHDYTLSRKGLHIDDRLYGYAEFREFGLITDDDEHSIMLIPRKRLRPGVTVYFPEEVGEVVVDMLAARLPMKQLKLDPLDKLVRFLRI